MWLISPDVPLCLLREISLPLRGPDWPILRLEVSCCLCHDSEAQTLPLSVPHWAHGYCDALASHKHTCVWTHMCTCLWASSAVHITGSWLHMTAGNKSHLLPPHCRMHQRKGTPTKQRKPSKWHPGLAVKGDWMTRGRKRRQSAVYHQERHQSIGFISVTAGLDFSLRCP